MLALINFSSDSYLKSTWMYINMFLMKIQSIASSVCQKELQNCFMIVSMVLLQINEPLRHRISILLCTDPSGKLPALELRAISTRCSSVCNHGWLERQPGQAGAAVRASHPRLLGSTFAPLSCPPAAAGLASPPTPRSSTRAAICVALPLLPLHSIK